MNSSPLITSFWCVWQTTWQASVLALVVMLVQRAVAGRLSTRARHALWLVVVARLLLPVLPASPVSLMGWAERLPAAMMDLADAALDDWSRERPGNAASTPPIAPLHAPRTAEEPLVTRLHSANPWQSAADSVAARHVPPPAIASARATTRERVCHTAALVWLCGLLLCVARGVWSWLRFCRRLPRGTTVPDARQTGMLQQACRQLPPRRQVRLAITPVVATPAVTGLWRATILLPPRMATELSDDQLRLVFLHELAHLRRGDVLMGWLASGLTAVHWFNPLLRHVFARMRQLRELACDQAVVAAIGAQQARDYGRTIVRVLELLEEAPALRQAAPIGVAGMAFWLGRDSDSIAERIRMLTHDARLPRRRSALLAALLWALLAAVGLTDASEPASDVKRPAPRAVEPMSAARAARATSADSRLVTRVYEARDVYEGLHKPDDAAHREWVGQWLQAAASPQGHGSYRWLDGHLLVRQTPEVHERLAAALAHLRKHGPEQIAVEVTLVTAPEEVVQQAPADWVVQQVQSERIVHDKAADRDMPANSALPAQASTVTRKELPVMLQVIGDEEARRLIERFQDHPRSNIQARPKIVTLNGQVATIATLVQRPFVVGLADGEPQIRVFDEDACVTRLQLVLIDGQTAWLECDTKFSQITDVQTADVRSRGGKLVTLQVPEVETTTLRTSVVLPLEKNLLLGGVKAQKVDGQWQSVVMLIKARNVGDSAVSEPPPTADAGANVQSIPPPRVLPAPIAKAATQARPSAGRKLTGRGVHSAAGLTGEVVLDQPAPAAAQDPSADLFPPTFVVTYYVADLVVPIPNYLLPMAKGSAMAMGSKEITPRPQIEFEPLIELITSTIAPETWDAPGSGTSIKPFAANLSLVVSHTKTVHEQVHDLIEQLRRQRELQVAVELRLLKLDSALQGDWVSTITFDSLVLDRRAGDKALKALVDQSRAVSMPKITLFDRQVAELSLARTGVLDPASLMGMRIHPVVSSDRRSVRLKLSLFAAHDVESAAATDTPPWPVYRADSAADGEEAASAIVMGQVADGGTILWDLSDKLPGKVGDSRLLLAATPRIVVPPEEEELLEPKVNFGGITPRMIIQEEEEDLLGLPLDHPQIRAGRE